MSKSTRQMQISQIEINVFDEMTNDKVWLSKAQLCLETGSVHDVIAEIPQGIPACKQASYGFSYGVLQLNGKELEFTLEAQKDASYRVPAREFVEMKEKAIALLQGKKVLKK